MRRATASAKINLVQFTPEMHHSLRSPKNY